MAAPLDTIRIQKYASELQMLLQQKRSKFRGTMTEATGYVGKQVSPVEQIGEINAYKRQQRFEPVRPTEANLTRRWVRPEMIVAAIRLDDPIDKIMSNLSLEGPYTEAIRAAQNRELDKSAIASFDALALVGENAESSIALPGSAEISVNLGGTNSDVNNAKLIAVREYFELMDAELDEEMIFVSTSPRQNSSMLALNTTLSSDYVPGRPITTGEIPPLFGLNFVKSNKLAKTGNVRTGYAWLKSGMHMGMWQDLQITIDRIPELHNSYLLQAWQTFGFTRLDEKKVVRVQFYEA